MTGPTPPPPPPPPVSVRALLDHRRGLDDAPRRPSTVHTMTVTVHATNLLTANQRHHWARTAAQTRVLRHTGAINARAQNIPAMDRAHLTVWVSWPDHRRRDVANLAPTIKALIDGIVQDAKRLPDDDDRHLVGPDLRVTDETSGLKGVTRLRFEFQQLDGRPGGED